MHIGTKKLTFTLLLSGICACSSGGDAEAPGDNGQSADLSAPTVPTSLTAQAISDSSITLTWDASSDDTSVAGYNIYRGDQKIMTATSTSINDSGLAADTTYEYAVDAFDLNNNTSARSNTVQATTTSPVQQQLSIASLTLVNADTDQDIRQLADGEVVDIDAIGTANLNIRADTDPATVGSVRFALDDDANYHTEGSVPYSLFSDSNGDYAAGQFPLGSRVVEAIPYSEVGGTGTAGTSLLVTFTVVGDDGTTPPPPPPPSDPTEEFSCLQTNTGAITALTGLQNSTRWFYDLPLNARLDLRNASFESITPDQDNWHPLQVRGGTSDNVCVAGGTIVGVRPLDISWRYTYANSQNHAAFRFENEGVRVHGVHVYNTWDGIRPATNGSNNWEIAHSWLEYIRDDCIENDQLQSGRVYDSFFDGCYVGYSNRPGSSSSGNTGAGKTVVFEKSLFRLEPMPYPQDEQSKDLLYVDGVPFGHNGFFKKFSGVNPRFVVKDSIFLYQWSPRPQAVSLTGIDECSNNTVVWLGPGDFPGDLTPGCFTVTTDINVWIDAVRDWHARHPNVGTDRKKPVDQQGNIWSYFPRFGQLYVPN